MAEQSKMNHFKPWVFRSLLLDYLVVIADAKMVSEILANSEGFPRSYHFETDNILFGGNVLFGIDGPVWKIYRKILNPFFTGTGQKNIFTIVKDVAMHATRILDRHCETNEPFDLHSLLAATTCNIICSFVLGKDFGCLDGDKLRVHRFYRTLGYEASLAHRTPLYLHLPLPRRIRFIAERARLRTLLLAAITSAPEDTLAGAIFRSGELSPSELATEILGIIFAGHDTTASAIAFCLGRYLPASPADAAAIRSAAAAAPADLALWTADDARCPAAAAAVRETLRLVPPGAAHPMQAVADTRVGEHLLRRGTPVLVDYHAAFRDPRHFNPDPDAFRPARWTDGTVDECARATGLPVARAFVPFLGTSPHACVGRGLAELEAGLLECTL